MGDEVRETEVGCRLRLVSQDKALLTLMSSVAPAGHGTRAHARARVCVCVCLAPFLHELGLLSFCCCPLPSAHPLTFSISLGSWGSVSL